VAAESTATIDAGGLQIHVHERRVVVRGDPVRLTPKEFDLLLCLAGNPNVTIAHTKLLQAVWGPDYGDEVEYLRTFINQLRKKIEAGWTRCYSEVRGAAPRAAAASQAARTGAA